jgi:hypothetical protein
MSLSSSGNVHNTCLRILRQRGFALSVDGEQDADGCYPTDCLWIAEKEGYRFAADNPIELLGLVAIYDHVQPQGEAKGYWWHVDGPDLWREWMQAAFHDKDP